MGEVVPPILTANAPELRPNTTTWPSGLARLRASHEALRAERDAAQGEAARHFIALRTAEAELVVVRQALTDLLDAADWQDEDDAEQRARAVLAGEEAS